MSRHTLGAMAELGNAKAALCDKVPAGLTLAQQQGLVGKFTPQFWALAFGGLSVVFFIRYLLAGLRFWGWLFPVSIFAALGKAREILG